MSFSARGVSRRRRSGQRPQIAGIAAALLVACVAAAFLATAFPSRAAEAEASACTAPKAAKRGRPDPDGTPTPVTVAIRLIDITKISDIDESVTIDAVFVQEWTDPRLGGLTGCRLSLADVWSAGLAVVNSGRIFPSFPDRVFIGDGGRVRYVQRYQGTLSFPHQLQAFPFDRHVIRFSLMPVEYAEDEIKLVVDETWSGRRDVDFVVPDWTISDASSRVTSIFLEVFDTTHARYDLEVSASRRSNYYIAQIIVPLTLIVAMSWAVFWINPSEFGTQIGMAATSMLTLIAFLFALRSIVPPVNYLTLMDKFIMGSTVLVFSALIEAMTTGYLVAHDRRADALRMDRICRWAFPAVFATYALIIFLSRD